MLALPVGQALGVGVGCLGVAGLAHEDVQGDGVGVEGHAAPPSWMRVNGANRRSMDSQSVQPPTP